MEQRLEITLTVFSLLIATTWSQGRFPLHLLDNFIPDTPIVVINEIDIDGESQFIELYDGGVGNTSLKGVAVAFYAEDGMAYRDAVSLDYYSTNEDGYYLLASNATLHNMNTDGLNAIAVFDTSQSPLDMLSTGKSVTATGILDAVVYSDTSTGNSDANVLVTTFSPNSEPLQDATLGKSLSRCRGWNALMPQSFVVTDESPNMDNDCILPGIVINEVNLRNETTLLDWYIELYDGGVGNSTLDGIIVALYHSELDSSFIAMDLTGRNTNSDGFFVIGLQLNPINNYDLVLINFPIDLKALNITIPTADGIALHLSSPRRFKSALVSINNYKLVDAIVFNNPQSSDLNLLHTLLPYQHRVNEVVGPNNEDRSVSRCQCCRRLDAMSFGEGALTPGAVNINCVQSDRSLSSSEQDYQGLVRISELKLKHPDVPDTLGEYIELSVNGFGAVKLDGLVVVVYGSDIRADRSIGLDGYETNEDGYFLIGVKGQTPTPDIEIEIGGEDQLINGAGGIVVYKGSASDFSVGSRPWGNRGNILDSLVFGFPGDLNPRLIFHLAPGQALIEVFPSEEFGGVPSILRCYSFYPTTQLAFEIGTQSPGSANNCPLPPVVLNELHVVSTEDKGEFLEISSLGKPFFPLDTMSVFLWKTLPDGTGVARLGIGLYGWQTNQNDGLITDIDGLFVINREKIQGRRPSFPISLGDKIDEAPGAVSLHVGRPGMFSPRTRVSNKGLVDAIVYGVSDDDEDPQDLIDVLLAPLTPPRTWYQNDIDTYRDFSINRCERENNTIEYIADQLSPNQTNYCPRKADSMITFNEVHLTAQSAVYIELWDMGNGDTKLDGLQLAFFQEDGKFTMSYNLTGKTDPYGYYVIGHAANGITPDMSLDRSFSLRRGGAAAIYNIYQSFNIGEKPKSRGLMSAVVHVMEPLSDEGTRNFDDLTPGSPPFVQTTTSALSSDGIALSRCYSGSLRVSSEAFIPTDKTYWSLNSCPVLENDVYINEVEVSSPFGPFALVTNEFIELYDGGKGNTTMKYLTLVLFDGSTPVLGGISRDVSYFAVDLDGKVTDDKGYFVIGTNDLVETVDVDVAIDTETTPFLQLGIVGVALYHAPIGAFLNGTPATNVSLVDTLIYATGLQELEHTLVDTLLPDVIGPGMVLETGSWLSRTRGSISRCLGFDRLDPQVFILTENESPKMPNDCGFLHPNFSTTVLITEVNLNRDNFFVELYDLGIGDTSLDELTLVLYGGGDQISNFKQISLSGKKTNGNGYFVIGNDTSDLLVGFFRDIVKGVALYAGEVVITTPTTRGLIDVVISNEADTNPLAGALLPGQIGVDDMDVEGLDRSISRCFARVPLDMFAFLSTMHTPGGDNACYRQKVVINEININHENRLGRNLEFLELYDGGVGLTPLTGMIVVVYSSDRDSLAVRVLPLNNTQTNSDGYFVIGKQINNFNIPPDLMITSLANLLPDNAGAIALYHDDQRNYKVGMEPSNINLVDVVVYGSDGSDPAKLLDILLPRQTYVVEDQGFMDGDESIARCKCCIPLSSSSFGVDRPTPGYDNPCTIPPPPSTSEIFISEIAMKTALFSTEYIELQGPSGLLLDNYFIVLYDQNGQVYFTEQLQDNIGPTGFFLIGSPNMRSPEPDIPFQSRFANSIQEEGGVVALYHGTAGDIRLDAKATDVNLVDAVVYKASADIEILGVDILTTDPHLLYADLKREESISRCYWQSTRKSNDFTQTDRSPGRDNVCPSEDYKQTVQMRLQDADFKEWENNEKLKNSLREVIIDGINMKCECGFNYHYISEEKILEGSVIYQADLLAFNANQSSLIQDSFTEFVSGTETLVIGGKTYKVDDCIKDCTGTKGNNNKSERSGSNSGAAVGVTITVILLVIIIIVVVFVLVRRRIICYTKDTRLTEEVGFTIGNKEFDDEIEFKDDSGNPYEPSY